MKRPVVYGSDYSVYVRIVRLALEEKGIDYELVPVDIFADTPPAFYRGLQPFGRIPAFEHHGFSLYETGALTRYIDEAFDGPALMPATAQERARVNQIISIADNYAYPNLVWGYYVELISKPAAGDAPDEQKMEEARRMTRLCLDAISELAGPLPWLAGGTIGLADLYLAPMVDYFLKAAEAREAFGPRPRLTAWWEAVSQRPAMTATRPSV